MSKLKEIIGTFNVFEALYGKDARLKNMRHIILYAEDYSYDIWEEYCDICGVPNSSISITIPFNVLKIQYQDN